MKAKTPIKVYYNSACPVCKAGIEYQQQRSTDGEIGWADVHAENTTALEVGELEFIRKVLHVTDEDGNVRRGIDAFIVLWQHSPSQRRLARVVALPGVKQITQLAYFLFAELLYRWNRLMRHW